MSAVAIGWGDLGLADAAAFLVQRTSPELVQDGRMDELERLQDAHTTYNDWVGTAAAEDSILAKSGSLYELAGLNSASWSILSVDIIGSSHGEDPRWTVYVYAVDRAEHQLDGFDDVKSLERARGSVPVTSVLLHDVTLDDIVRTMKTVHFQLRRTEFPHLDITIRSDHPVQSD